MQTRFVIEALRAFLRRDTLETVRIGLHAGIWIVIGWFAICAIRSQRLGFIPLPRTTD